MESKKENDSCRIEWCERPIVRVLGTVMTRDDALGGWVPYMNGGQSKVGILESVDGRRYRIYGWRVNDKKVTLDCFIQRHMVFHETIGTFHHWKIGDRKMGLTFYTPAEARSFNRGVRVALEQLARVAEYTCSSTSSTCSRSSDDHQSSCTSPASSTGSSCGVASSGFSKQKQIRNGKKISSTSSASSSSSRLATSRHRRSPGTKPGRSRRITHNSTSSSASAQLNRPTNGHHNGVAPVVTAAPTLSLMSTTTSPRFCDTPSSCDMGQTHFRWPQTYPATLSFLSRPMTKEGSPYELSALALPSPHSASSTMCRDAEGASGNKNPTSLPRSGTELEQGADCVKGHDSVTPPSTQSHNRESIFSQQTEERRTSPSHRNEDPSSTARSKSYRHTKTPYLDILERQRDLKPTEPNSYVLFSSSKPATAIGSQRTVGRTMSAGMTTSLSGIHCGDYKALGHMSLVDGYQYHPLLSTLCTERPYHHPQTGTLSIMASTTDASRYYNRNDVFYYPNIDNLKDDTVLYEPRSGLLSTPKKGTKLKDLNYYGECYSEDEGRNSDRMFGCCPRRNSGRLGRRRNASSGRYKEDLAERSKCRYCHEMFVHELNKPGSCRDAPDKCLKSIEKVTCLFCADTLFYHCCRDDEGDYDDEPCTCTTVQSGGRSKFWRRWTALAALSIFLPCLCLYPPLRACHSCGVACNCCGGTHQAPFPSNRGSDKQSQGKR